MSDDGWTWQFRTPAKRTYDDLDAHARDRITDKLDEIVNDQWRDPDDYLEPLTGAPHSKLRMLAEALELHEECGEPVDDADLREFGLDPDDEGDDTVPEFMQ